MSENLDLEKSYDIMNDRLTKELTELDDILIIIEESDILNEKQIKMLNELINEREKFSTKLMYGFRGLFENFKDLKN